MKHVMGSHVTHSATGEAIVRNSYFFSISTSEIDFAYTGRGRLLERWHEIGVFKRQLELSKVKKPYTFYDGPSLATGLPHYGH